MPGIYTHNYIFRKSVEGILKSKTKTYMNRSLDTLFSTPENFRAGLFGSIGPNIFDYMNILRKGNNLCNEVSFALHNRSCIPYLKNMTDIALHGRDSRNEWASAQRGYLYGYISHIIADSVLHPYIFYISGFPERMTRGEVDHYRRMNLRFQYNIDNWFLYRDEMGGVINSLDKMLPVQKYGRRKILWPSIKYLILESLRREDEAMLRRNFRDLPAKIDGDTVNVKNLDRIPATIALCYRLKRSDNRRVTDMIDRLSGTPLTFSDFFVRYPGRKRVDEDAMNIHQGRWQYPATQRGFRYESVLHLIKGSIDQIVRAWEMLEPAIYGAKVPDISEIVNLNAYTGEKGIYFEEMKIKDPARLKV